MKKKVLFLLIMVSLFTLTACGSKSGTSTKTKCKLDLDGSFEKITYKYSSEATIEETETSKRIRYGDYDIIISKQKDKKIEELVEAKKLSFKENKTIQTIKWQVYTFKGNVISTIYLYEVDSDTYNVTFTHDSDKDIELDDIINEFMKNVSFQK